MDVIPEQLRAGRLEDDPIVVQIDLVSIDPTPT